MRARGIFLLFALVLVACAGRPQTVPAATAEQEVSMNQQFSTIVMKPQIWGGTSVASGTFRFVSALGVSSRLGYFTQTCGGVLIDADWVLTAAHCAGNNTLILGRRNPTSSGGEVHSFASKNVFCHKDFDDRTLENDIALIQLFKSSAVTPVVMGSNDNWEASVPPPTVVLAGWGIGTSSSNLQRVPVQLLTDRARCEHFLQQGDIVLDTNSFCTFSPTGGALDDDSGGPVFLPQPGGMLLVGIMSAGDIAGEPNKHSRVSRYRSWISDVMSGGRTLTKSC